MNSNMIQPGMLFRNDQEITLKQVIELQNRVGKVLELCELFKNMGTRIVYHIDVSKLRITKERFSYTDPLAASLYFTLLFITLGMIQGMVFIEAVSK